MHTSYLGVMRGGHREYHFLQSPKPLLLQLPTHGFDIELEMAYAISRGDMLLLYSIRDGIEWDLPAGVQVAG